MDDKQDLGLKTSPKLLALAAGGLTLTFAAKQATISNIDLDLSVALFATAAIAALIALAAELRVVALWRRRAAYEDAFQRERKAMLQRGAPEDDVFEYEDNYLLGRDRDQPDAFYSERWRAFERRRYDRSVFLHERDEMLQHGADAWAISQFERDFRQRREAEDDYLFRRGQYFGDAWPRPMESVRLWFLIFILLMAILTLYGKFGWWRLLPLTIAVAGAVLVSLYEHPLSRRALQHLFAAAASLSLASFALGAIVPIAQWGQEGADNVQDSLGNQGESKIPLVHDPKDPPPKGVGDVPPATDPTTGKPVTGSTPKPVDGNSPTTPPPPAVDTSASVNDAIDRLIAAIKSGNPQQITDARTYIQNIIDARRIKECPAVAKGEKGDKGDKGDRGDPGPPGVCGS